MNYVLVSLGPTPKHFKNCLQQILTVDKNKTVYLITDQNILCPRVTVINVNEFILPDIGDYFKYNPNPLWYTSLLRIFYLNAFLQIKKEPIIHFDNDVLVYYPSSIIDLHTEDEIYITPHKTTEYTFGFSVLKSVEKFNKLTEKIYNLVLLGEQKIKEQFCETHEMSLLGACKDGLIKDLPVHPSLSPTFENFVFDPSSYGQFVDGTPNGHSSGFIDETQLVGNCFKLFPPIINFVDNLPILTFEEKEYKLFNLHIHSKNLEKYET